MLKWYALFGYFVWFFSALLQGKGPNFNQVFTGCTSTEWEVEAMQL